MLPRAGGARDISEPMEELSLYFYMTFNMCIKLLVKWNSFCNECGFGGLKDGGALGSCWGEGSSIWCSICSRSYRMSGRKRSGWGCSRLRGLSGRGERGDPPPQSSGTPTPAAAAESLHGITAAPARQAEQGGLVPAARSIRSNGCETVSAADEQSCSR